MNLFDFRLNKQTNKIVKDAQRVYGHESAEHESAKRVAEATRRIIKGSVNDPLPQETINAIQDGWRTRARQDFGPAPHTAYGRFFKYFHPLTKRLPNWVGINLFDEYHDVHLPGDK